MQKKKLIINLFAIVAVLAILAVPLSIKTVGASQRGVVLNWGAFNGRVLQPGLNWRVPVMQHIVKMNVSVQKSDVTATAATKDLQDVTTIIALNWSLQPERVGDVYVSYQRSIDTRLILPSVQEAVKAATAKFTAEELITRRSEVRDEIRVNLLNKIEQAHVIINEFNIVEFTFSSSFNTAIESKVRAEQEALTAKNQLDRVRFEAEQRIATATAEAEAIRIQAGAIQQQGGANYVNLKAIEKWDGKLPQQFVPGSALPFVTLK